MGTNERKESRWITQGHYKQFLHHQWMPMVHNFIGKWGKTMVINDMCVAVNDVEGSLGMTRRTSCPPYLIILLDQKSCCEPNKSSTIKIRGKT